jgi:hypothetical protein
LAMISSGRKPLRGMILSSIEPAPSLTSAWTDSRGEGQQSFLHRLWPQKPEQIGEVLAERRRGSLACCVAGICGHEASLDRSAGKGQLRL